jgi:hypothetical protein
VLKQGTVSTNVYLRRAHNIALRRRWIHEPVLLPDDWPSVEHAPKRGITEREHGLIIAREHNPEWRAYYQFLRETGGTQTDIATLCAENINWHATDENGQPRAELQYIRCKLRRKNPPPSNPLRLSEAGSGGRLCEPQQHPQFHMLEFILTRPGWA